MNDILTQVKQKKEKYRKDSWCSPLPSAFKYSFQMSMSASYEYRESI